MSLSEFWIENQMEEGRKNAAAAEQTSYSSDSDDSLRRHGRFGSCTQDHSSPEVPPKIPALKKAAAPEASRGPLTMNAAARVRLQPQDHGRRRCHSLEEMVRRNMNLVTAEELLKASVVSDRADWISFNYDSDSDTNIQQLEEWLESNRPSLIKSASSGIGWISVSLPRTRERDKVERGGYGRGQAEWEACPSKTNAANSLAKRMEITSGKWLVHVQPEEVDATWNKIAHSVVARKFGPTVLGAKVSPLPEELDVHM